MPDSGRGDTSSARVLATTAAEVVVLTSPVGVGVVGVAFVGFREILVLFLSCVSGLILGLWLGRVTRFNRILNWPRPTAQVEWATSGVAYSGAGAISVILGSMAWTVVNQAAGLAVAAIIPLWFLRHLRILLQPW